MPTGVAGTREAVGVGEGVQRALRPRLLTSEGHAFGGSSDLGGVTPGRHHLGAMPQLLVRPAGTGIPMWGAARAMGGDPMTLAEDSR